jgi:xanthine dehydrogenase accessory factor
MDDIWVRAEALLAEGKPFVLATIISTRGSVPREVGAKMVVPQEGQPFGTIGGGCGEGEVLRRAYPLFAETIPSRVVRVDLTGDFDQEAIQVCGGLMDVALDLWRPDAHRPLAQALAEATRARRRTALVTTIQEVDGVPPGTKSCLALDGVTLTPEWPLDAASLQTCADTVAAGKPRLLSLRSPGDLFIDVQPGLQTLLIVGAGHIAQPLCEIGYLLGFRTVVVDDRRAFANRERFPHATDIVVGPFVETLERFDVSDQTFAVVVTRGHNWDEGSVRTLLAKKTPLAYLGMIGSKRRAKATLERLAAQGFDPEALSRIYTPMGLDLRAESPAEIALAIAAEIVRVRRQAPADSLSLAAKARPRGPLQFSADSLLTR